MYNPLMLFTKEALDNLIKEGCLYFIRQSYPRGVRPGVKEAFIITPYVRRADAYDHFEKIREDPRKWLYILNSESQDHEAEHNKLLTASMQPDNYRVYFNRLTSQEWMPPPHLQMSITNYVKNVLGWRPGHIQTRLSIRLGVLVLIFVRSGISREATLDEVEKC